MRSRDAHPLGHKWDKSTLGRKRDGDDRWVAGLGGRRRRRNWQLIGAVFTLLIVVSSVYAVWQILHGGLQPADTAGLLGLPLGVLSE
jgi:hypothetical protein